MNLFFGDVRYTFRSYRRAPTFFSLVIGILTLGIGISVSIFSLVDGVLVRPLPYRDPPRLVALTTYAPRPPFDSNGSVSYNDYKEIALKCTALSEVAVTYRTGWSRVNLTGGTETMSVQGAFVSPNLFGMFGRRPMLGRTFTEEENRRGERVVVISHAMWADRFGSSPEALGQDLEIGRMKWRVIGVMPADFEVPFLETQVWAPILSHPEWNDTEEANPQEHPRWDVMARLRDGVSRDAAQAQLNAIWNGLRTSDPEFHNTDIKVVPLRDHFTGEVRKPLAILLCAVVFLLLIACANVGNLLLAWTAEREHEMAVRAALGAGYGRILQQLVTEALTTSIIAGVLGSVAAWNLVPLLKLVAPASTPLLNAVAFDSRALLCTLGISVGIGLMLGLAPLIRIGRDRIQSSLGVASRAMTDTRAGLRMKGVLVITEFALAMVLLTGAGLLIRSFVSVLNVKLGFEPDHVLTVKIGLPDNAPRDRELHFYSELMQRISALPGVRSVGGAGNLFFLDERRNHALKIVEGHPPEQKEAWKPLVWTQVGGDYFQAMGIPLLRGRFFNTRDLPDSPPVVIVNQTLARRYWPGEDAIGKRLKGFDPRGQHDDWLTVVGVVQDTRSGGIERAPYSQIYEVQAQRSGEHLNNLVIRTTGNAPDLGASIRTLVHGLERDATFSGITTMRALLEEQTTPRRFQTWLVSSFSAGALLLAVLGIFAVAHYAVSARTNEIGIRMAIGANQTDITRLVLGNSMRVAMAGIAIGGLLSLWSAKLISGLLFGVTWYDPASIGFAGFLLLGVSVLGSYVPSYRASRIDPLTALREE